MEDSPIVNDRIYPLPPDIIERAVAAIYTQPDAELLMTILGLSEPA